MKRSNPIRVGLVLAITLASWTFAAPAVASPGKPGPVAGDSGGVSLAGLPKRFTSWQQLFDVQRGLDDAATRIEGAVSKNLRSGFTSVRVDPETDSLTLYWQGEPSQDENGAVAAVRSSGVAITVKPARYSRQQLDAQVELIELDARPSTGDRVQYITKHPDGSGVTVGVGAAAAPGTQLRAAPAPLGQGLTSLRAAVANGGVTVVAAPQRGNPALSREADTSPYWGGSLLWSLDHGNGCSTGFAVHWPADNNDYLTTAAHCGYVGSHWSTWTDRGDVIGTMTDGNPGYDMRFIRLPNGAGGTIYTGAPAFTSGQTATPVSTASHTRNGDWLCVSGAFRGLRCSIRASGPTHDCRDWVTKTGVGLADAHGCFNVEGGISSVSELFVGHGDSGGPVFVPINGINQPNSRADARGLVSSRPDGWEEEYCWDPVFGESIKECQTAVWFTDLLSAIAPWTASGMYVK